MGLRTRTKLAIKTALFGGAVSYAERLVAQAEAELEVLRQDTERARGRLDRLNDAKAVVQGGFNAWMDGFTSAVRGPGGIGEIPDPPRRPRDLH